VIAGGLTTTQLEEFSRLSTCIVASAIETFRVRLPNVGLADSTVRCIFKDLPPVAGYAATGRIRTASPPMHGWGYNYERSDWWNHILSIPAPRVVVLEDLDDSPGLGAFVGEVYANILRALGCVGLVTNGGVRDVPEVRFTGLQMFAGNVSVSHAYAHIVDFGAPVVAGGLKVGPGDLIHGDQHGIQTIPMEIAEKIPAAAHEISQRRRQLVNVCRSPGFTTERLRAAIKETRLNHEDNESRS
jgi:4-hydroxy-4-methyl-2-oxoglutarate aldolase